jgi:hypothetical protein
MNARKCFRKSVAQNIFIDSKTIKIPKISLMPSEIILKYEIPGVQTVRLVLC